MGGVMDVATPILSGIGAGAKIISAEQTKSQLKKAGKEQEAALDDLSLRREATYRNSRIGLQGAIEDFYKQKGWKIPERLPGAFTTRGLPGEGPLYPEEGATSVPLTADESDAVQIANQIDSGTPSDVGQVDVPPVRRPLVVDAQTSVPVPRAPLIGKPIGTVDAAMSKKDDYAPIYIPNRSYGINKILPLLSK